MKETVRVVLRGKYEELRSSWESETPWPFSSVGVAVFPSDSHDLRKIRYLIQSFPGVKSSEVVEREYSNRELRQFDALVLWVNHQLNLPKGIGFEHGPACPGCGFVPQRVRIEPIDLKKGQLPRKDISITDDWELVVSDRVARAWLEAGFTGASFAPVLVDGTVSEFQQMVVECDISTEVQEALRYEGPMCEICGRYHQTYPVHPSKEIWLPQSVWPGCDITHLNERLERTHHHRKVLSGRAYRLLLDIKATGYWVQPLHLS